MLQRATEVAEETNSPTFQWLVANYQCATKMITESVDDIEAAAFAALQLGTDSEQPDALVWFATQLFLVREVQGRVGEVLDLIQQQEAAMSSSPAWQGALALALVRDGQVAKASLLIDELLTERGDDPFPHDAAWLILHATFGMAVAAAGSADQASREYEHLIPYAGRLSTGGFAISYPVSLVLAVLAARAGWPERTRRHFPEVLEQAESLGARIWLARTQLEWGRFLLDEGEIQHGRDLLLEARQGAQRMAALGIMEEAALLLNM